MSAHIKLITEDTDISKLDIYKNNWDVKICGRPYQVACIPGYVHTIGGRMGENNLWAWPLNEKPTYENIIQYNGPFGCAWGYSIEPHISIKSKWDETEARDNIIVRITRNGETFHTFTCNDELYALAKAHMILNEIKEGPILFSNRDWEKNVIGRKIYYANQPAIITRCHGFEVFVEPDRIESFECPAWMKEDGDEYFWEEDYAHGLYVDVDSDLITWFREEDNA